MRSDPRFDQGAAQRTGYVPRSIAAVPLVDDGATVGVLQVLDKRSTPTFTLRDMELLAVFARQAAAAIEASKVQRDTARLLRGALLRIADDGVSADQVDELVRDATTALDADEDDRTWELVEMLAAPAMALGSASSAWSSTSCGSSRARSPRPAADAEAEHGSHGRGAAGLVGAVHG